MVPPPPPEVIYINESGSNNSKQTLSKDGLVTQDCLNLFLKIIGGLGGVGVALPTGNMPDDIRPNEKIVLFPVTG